MIQVWCSWVYNRKNPGQDKMQLIDISVYHSTISGHEVSPGTIDRCMDTDNIVYPKWSFIQP